MHAHALGYEVFDSTPRLAALSAEKGSGKTRLLEVLELVCPNPLHTVNISAAALFRKVDGEQPTLLLDEADTYLGQKVAQQHEDVRGLINAGHWRGAVATRCEVGKGVTVKEFQAFCAAGLAGIGDLPDTILDRSIIIGVNRRVPHEHIEPFRRRRALDETAGLKDELATWAQAYAVTLDDDEPVMPEGITDRPADVWEPLVIIGDRAGPDGQPRYAPLPSYSTMDAPTRTVSAFASSKTAELSSATSTASGPTTSLRS